MLHEGLTENTWDGLSKFRDAEAIWITVAGTPLLIVGLGQHYFGADDAWNDWLWNASLAWAALIVAYGVYATVVSVMTLFGNKKNRD